MHTRSRVILVLGVMNLIYAFSYFHRIAIPGTIFNQLQSDFALSSAGVALLGGIFLYVYGGMQIVTGLLVDRFGPIRVTIAGGIVTSIGTVLFPLSHGTAMLYGSRFLVGLGASVLYLALIKQLDLCVSPKNFSAVLSVSLVLGFLGGLMGTKPFEAGIALIGWRESLLWIGLIGSVVVAIGIGIMWPMRGDVAEVRIRDLFTALLRIMRNRLSYAPMLCHTSVYGIYFVFQAIIGKKLLQDYFHLDDSAASGYTFALMAASLAGILAAGFVSRMMGNRRKPIMIAAAFTAMLSQVMILLAISGLPQLIFPAYVMLGVSTLGTPIFNTAMKELNDPEFVGSAVGVLNTAAYIGIAIFATLAGVAMDHFSAGAVRTAAAVHYPLEAYRAIVIGCLSLSAVAFLLSFLIRETAGNSISIRRKVSASPEMSANVH